MELAVSDEPSSVDTEMVLVLMVQSMMVLLMMVVAVKELTVREDPTKVENWPALMDAFVVASELVVSVEATVIVFAV
jgi:hypothetical protein